MKRLLKKAVYRAALPILRADAARRGLTFGICAHRFEASYGADPKSGVAITAEAFRNHLRALQDIGTFIHVDDLLSEARSPGIRFFLTFDDGYSDNYSVLLPILEDLEVPCCIFAVSSFVSGKMKELPHDRKVDFCPFALTPDELRLLSDHPLVTIGSHTATHPNLGRSTIDEFKSEVGESKNTLEQILGKPVEHFAFPFGQPADMNWTEGVDALAECGYRSIFSNFGGANDPSRCERRSLDGRSITHFKRVPLPNTDCTGVLTAWTLGMSNLRERYFSTDYMAKEVRS